MRLIFYSGGGHELNQELDAWLLRMLGSNNPKCTVIPSCYDHRDEDIDDFIEHFGPLGFTVDQVIDADRFPSASDIDRAMAADFVYLSGGNTFYFLEHLRRSGLLKALRRFAQHDGLIAGKSAGAIIMTPNIQTAAVPDFDCDENSIGITNLDAMNLVSFEFFPHYPKRRAHDEEFFRYTRISNKPLYACPDGSGVVVYEDQVALVGEVEVFFDGRKFRPK
jgi:dipeptidase E